MNKVIDNTTDNVEIYEHDGETIAAAYAVIVDEDTIILFDTMAQARSYAEQFVYYHIEPWRVFLGLDGTRSYDEVLSSSSDPDPWAM